MKREKQERVLLHKRDKAIEELASSVQSHVADSHEDRLISTVQNFSQELAIQDSRGVSVPHSCGLPRS